MTTIWDPIELGGVQLPHRLALAPMTRSRAGADGVPGPLTAEYYAQRAGLGLLITEGVQPSEDGQGYMNTPGIHTAAQQAAWREVAERVHAAGGRIFMQLMHAGRVGHPDNTPHHRPLLAPSAIATGEPVFTPTGPQPAPVPQALTTDEIRTTVDDFRRAAAAAIAAGFDGVEIHGANGYLINQFLAPTGNVRTDEYGGSIDNRIRFALEVAAAVAGEIGPERTGIRLSPGFVIAGLDEGPEGPELYRRLVERLAALDLAYLHLFYFGDEALLAEIRALWPNALLLVRPGRTREQIGRDLAAGIADIEPIGTFALANPDLVERLKSGAEFNTADKATFFGGGAAGYTDYPRLPVHEAAE
ncbi:2,4-dienoyl-CoA reductase-like NADH-dependent reductase (Old Yellow Enzyme family) [Kaistia hirudinis]|uniref:2,4-dienoyl-CoA reductase-like NADH-dependent reductase (Old Yellow Enzyme family) n=1 Tax=Kaistia hirudinis TaxID=1293440 RepID=A0A840APD2_9HYPH|nr:alkene reductase [Kaistia hirudinis]MBB3930721.1 2,4-dienoyl-CoA reductase-like NADH-dependent reductase (Old Yellow Enzyme family) [Kaistia hirudinis]MBN9017297.1 alkene reductase [Hyphomicrobiales bacterium]